MASFREQFWDPIAGFGVTFRTMFKKVVTEQYPFEKLPTAPRFHGRHQLNRWPDGLEKCILCGLCIEACPTRALTMTNEYELADNSRESLIYEKKDLLAPLLPGMEAPPHPMRLGDDERAYYLGAGAVPTRSPYEPGPSEPNPSEPNPSEPGVPA